ncbi:MAG: class I SAM-dependent methyltransferase [Acidobacteriota bacterium]|nr:class I SAM-dependent methyltransferase [Acidobacteriota bacterium]
MELKELQKNWNQFGKQDPLWAIITWDDKKGNKWDPNEFFETGEQEIREVMQYVEKLGLLRQRGRALDFGCGVGRLTQALANYFETVLGIDIAPSMVKLADQYNRFGARCTYRVNAEDNLRSFADQQFDFIYTNIVLQHMRPDYAKSYIKEFLRVLKPDGVLVFQLPSRQLVAPPRVEASSESVYNPPPAVRFGGIKGFIKRHVPEWLWRWYVDLKYSGRQPILEMYGVERAEVESFLKDNGARVVDVVNDDFAGHQWEGFRYCVTKY